MTDRDSYNPNSVRRGFAAVWDSVAPPGRLLCGRLTGSRAYGTDRPDSDWDWGGAFVAPTARVIGLHWEQTDETASYTKGEGEDWTFHEAKKFLNVLENANANTLEALFMPPDCVVPGDPALAPFWNELVAHRREFVTEKVVKHYVAYANSQLMRVRGVPVRESKKRPNKPVDLMKDAAHGLRLLYDARAIAVGGEPSVRLAGSERALVMACLAKDMSADDVVGLAADLTAEVEALKPWPVRAEYPTAFAEDWLVRVRRFDLLNPVTVAGGTAADGV